MIVVAKDGSGDYTSIQEAIDNAPAEAGGQLHLLVKAGEYRERVVIHRDGLRLTGEDRDRTVITRSGCARDPGPDGSERGTFLSATMIVTGRDAAVENLTVRNDAGDGSLAGQAVAVYAAGDRGIWRNCRFLAHQDTLFCGPLMPKVAADIAPYGGSAECVPSVGDCLPTEGRQYFENCFIRGDIDFIFGPYRCWFEGCTLFMNGRGGWYTAANTPEGQPWGFVFRRCRLTGACEEGKAFLGRPWRKYARTVFLRCDMDAHVAPEGFADWDAERRVTGRYAEFGTTGARADLTQRHPAETRLTAEEAEGMTPEAVLGGRDGWRPHRREAGA